MRIIVCISLALLLVTFSVDGIGSSANAADNKFLTLVAGGSAGSWYVGSAIISEIFNSVYKDMKLTPVPGGGVSNMKSLQSGKAEFGYMICSTVAHALKGTGPFKKKLGKLRAVMALAPITFHVLVRDDSDIKSIKDLEGKRISPGKKGFTTGETFLALLPEYGLSAESIKKKGGKLLWLDYSDATQMMRDGLVDSLVNAASIPHTNYIELSTAFKLRFIPIESDVIARFSKMNPGWAKGAIPGGIYPGVDKPVQTLVDSMGIATRADMPDAIVYKFTKAVYENRKKLIEGYPAYAGIGPEAVINDSLKALPIHPGAAKYWKEIGLLK